PFGKSPVRGRLRRVLGDKTGKTGDRAKYIVEIMRYTAGQLADGLHLRGLAEAVFQRGALRHRPASLGDVGQPRDHAAGRQSRAMNLQLPAIDMNIALIVLALQGG